MNRFKGVQYSHGDALYSPIRGGNIIYGYIEEKSSRCFSTKLLDKYSIIGNNILFAEDSLPVILDIRFGTEFASKNNIIWRI